MKIWMMQFTDRSDIYQGGVYSTEEDAERAARRLYCSLTSDWENLGDSVTLDAFHRLARNHVVHLEWDVSWDDDLVELYATILPMEVDGGPVSTLDGTPWDCC